MSDDPGYKFLHDHLFGSDDPAHINRPHVTLTFAQSLDGKIAGGKGKQLILSGEESMNMTHWMRSMHDGILVGIGTAINDDPQLNIRRLPSDIRSDKSKWPRPIILDSTCRLPLACKLLKNYSQGTGLQPWIICSPNATPAALQNLQTAGANVVLGRADAQGRLDILGVLSQLSKLGIRTLMVEGGQKIISTFLNLKERGGLNPRPVVDRLIVTVAPRLVGGSGVGALDDGNNESPDLIHLRSINLGQDTVVALRIAG